MQKYKNLERIVIDLRDMMDPYVVPQEVWATLQESMPQLKEKGVLVLHPRFRDVKA